jgi:RNA polymerase sigma factor (sigma-70 family)
MLGSREDAEDVVQEVFAAAFNAILGDDRPINVRPWLYRIARNRSLNHLRRASAVGMDSMDTYFADHGQSVPERILQRENFHALVEDIGRLAETQRTALLLREIDALSYEQIAEVMDTTVPSVKSLLVRARVALAEAAEARQLSCEEVRQELGEAAEGLTRVSPPVRRHVRDCARCRSFSKQLKRNEKALAALLPVGGIVPLLHRLLATKLGSTGAGGAYAAGGGGGAVAGAGAASGLGGAGSIAGVGGGAVAAKAVAGLAAAALLSAGAVEVGHNAPRHHAPASQPAVASNEVGRDAPAVVASVPQAITSSHPHTSAGAASARVSQSVSHVTRSRHHTAVPTSSTRTASPSKSASKASSSSAGADANARASDAHGASETVGAQVAQAMTVTTQSATNPAPAAHAAPEASAPPQAGAQTPAPAEPPADATGPTGATGSGGETGSTGATAEPAPQPPSEATSPNGSKLESSTGGAQAPPPAAEAPPAP